MGREPLPTINKEAIMANTTNNATTASKKVKIKLPLTRGEKDDVWVALNGKSYLIKRGETVEVPAGVAEILQHKEEQLAQAMAYEEEAAANADQ